MDEACQNWWEPVAAAAAAAVYPACDGTSCECHRLADEVTVVVYVKETEK